MKPTLEERLRALELPLPPSLYPQQLVAAARPRVLQLPRSASRPVRASKWLTRALAAVALLVISNFGALQIWPSYRGVLADTPVFGPVTMGVLSGLGLAPSAPGATPTRLAVSQMSGGTRVTLRAGYADAIRTVLLLTTPQALVPFFSGPDQPTLTDQYGQTLKGLPDGNVSGEQILLFPPLSASASTRPISLTLSIPAMFSESTKSAPLVHVAGYPAGTKGDYPGPVTIGHWSLSFRLRAMSGVSLPPPAMQVEAGTTYTITGIMKSGPFLDVAWTESGLAPTQASTHASSFKLANAVLGDYELYAPTGQVTTIVTQSGSLQPTSSTATNEAIFAINGAGTYRLVMGAGSSVAFEVHVP